MVEDGSSVVSIIHYHFDSPHQLRPIEVREVSRSRRVYFNLLSVSQSIGLSLFPLPLSQQWQSRTFF